MHVSRRRSATARRLAASLLCASFVIGTSVPAFADADDVEAPKMDNRARAQQLFDSALADAEAGNLASACPKFLASQEADPKTSTLLNLASCYEKNGQTASAWGAFREAEGLARKVSRSDWENTARSHAERLEPKLLRLTITVPEGSRLPGLTVARDGARIGAGEWSVAIPVDPGEHLVVASAPGHAPWEMRVPVRDASGAVAVPPLEALPEAHDAGPGTGEQHPQSWWTPLRTTGVVVAGVGVVGLVTGTILGVVAKGKYDSAHDLCANGTHGCPANAVSDSNSAYSLASGATVVFVIGAVAAVGGVALVLLSPSPSETRSGATKSVTRGTSASLVVGPGSLGVNGTW
jgi:hypothetical protein